MQQSAQLITENKEFNEDFPRFLKDVGLDNVGFDYHVVAVLGSQSTGKSTLLNKLFGTQFSTMDTVRRQQTTKGIWVSRGKDSSILIMDVEGTDGRERGDDQDFERKSALFSIATSEVIIVNMWENQIGLYQGSNMTLLKTVFEVNLQLFHENIERSRLQFVIRDFLGSTSLDNLSETLMTDLNRTWASISKPEGLENSVITDFFDVDFSALPHKVLCAEAFDEETDKLREQFLDEKNPKYLFKPCYHKRIPADGFPLYTQGIWQLIQNNRDLDLPTQQQLLAQYRCDEFIAEAMVSFDEQCEELLTFLKTHQSIENLLQRLEAIQTSTFSIFDENARRYQSEVYTKKRQELDRMMKTRLAVPIQRYLAAIHKELVAGFPERIATLVKDACFKDVARVTVSEMVSVMHSEAAALQKEGFVCDAEQTVETLRVELLQLVRSMREERLAQISAKLMVQFEQEFADAIDVSFHHLTKDIWDNIMHKFDELREKVLDEMLRSLNEYIDDEMDEDAELLRTKHMFKLKRSTWLVLRRTLENETAEPILQQRLRTHFEDSFRYDSRGIPKMWKKSDILENDFNKSLQDTLQLIDVLAIVRLKDGSVPTVDVPLAEEGEDTASNLEADTFFTFLNRKKKANIHVSVKRAADLVFLDCKRSIISTATRVPGYFWALLAVLGWNEFVSVLKNPVLLTLLLIVVSFLFILVQTGLAGPVKAFAERSVRNAVNSMGEKLAEKLDDYRSTSPASETTSGRVISAENSSVDEKVSTTP
ncbi:GTP binding protein Sey1 [Schizosaccharomyces japonicus yFS275]|uniref:Protein sey1 n=1 Tax=Schizosaccharomyces japonicus (strain yFS275 / FY16936) TaxID=402676 RepID=SEY1_SCHJY|nr:GTP binding protein Sey1 [Schizosaccharomyces japonicus yFS275]B6K0N7.1 RecName: Full=Protein sey1 [Schizosaccharomyces japonicus yFS275]EEB07508.1 GTP binding protein Sey1 [Schizosaccharomyces japonicus yFS275]